jgi:hypothetical protein
MRPYQGGVMSRAMIRWDRATWTSGRSKRRPFRQG